MNINRSKYSIVLCELHYTPFHGKTKDSDPSIDSHYLLIGKFHPITNYLITEDYDTDEEVDEEVDEDDEIEEAPNLKNMLKFYKGKYKKYKEIHVSVKPHETIRNYFQIVTRDDYLKPELGECILLPTQEIIVICKTFWIRIIQKKWKKILKTRKDIIYNSNFINKYQMGNKLSSLIPGIRGMLYDLKRRY